VRYISIMEACVACGDALQVHAVKTIATKARGRESHARGLTRKESTNGQGLGGWGRVEEVKHRACTYMYSYILYAHEILHVCRPGPSGAEELYTQGLTIFWNYRTYKYMPALEVFLSCIHSLPVLDKPAATYLHIHTYGGTTDPAGRIRLR
jgi:hypothetical protein